MERNTDWLRDRFIERLLALSPASVLDLGAGHGQLVASCRAAGIEAWGVEPEAASLEAALPEARPFLSPLDGVRLPYDDDQFDWVTLRHVPHHLEDPHGSFAEAWRVARVGLVVGEPRYDDTREDGRRGDQADRWLKRMDRRRGMFHADCLRREDLLGFLPAQPASVEEHFFFAGRPWDHAEMVADGEHSARGLELEPEERREWELLLEAAARDEVGHNGTLVLICTK